MTITRKLFLSLAALAFLTCPSLVSAQEHKDKEHDGEHAHGDHGQEEHTAAHWMEYLNGADKAFNGTSLDGWRGYKQEEVKGWEVADGTLHRSGSGGDIMTTGVYKNFVLSLEWKVAEAGNSGIMYRVRQGDGAPYMSGIEYQILDNERHADGKSDLTSAGSIYALYPTDKSACHPAGEWNKTIIAVVGNHVEHWLNDKLVAKTELWGEDWTKRFKASKFSGWDMFGKSAEGHIALQDHNDLVWYKNIVIKEVSDEDIKAWHEKHGVKEHAAAE